MNSEFWYIIIIVWLYFSYQIIKFLCLYLLAKRYKITGLRALNWVTRWVFGQNKAAFPVHWTSQVIDGHKISIERAGPSVLNSFAWSGNCYYQAKNGIEIHDGAIWGPGCKFISANHDPADMTHFIEAPPLVIGSGVWVGAGAVILPGVEIGPGCIIGAGSVVTKSFTKGLIITGNPARVKGFNHDYFLKDNA